MDGKLTFILGGTRSGKSQLAVELASQRAENVLFVATAEPGDDEMRRRIGDHRRSRPPNWRTLEAPLGVGPALTRAFRSEGAVIVDCLSLLVSNILVQSCSPTPPGDMDVARAEKSVTTEMQQLLEATARLNASFIVVSNEVGMGLVPDNPLGRIYRDLLGLANQSVARSATEVILMVAGLPWRLKG
ncbi:MAG: bifunctional adenosylcobinamide kinase/adenosylcobinamide-phosphate guanylyltransferase [Chloroflexi bacterium]|nr:bifunctional adenosylcobinamide kinase/adenosylcobinamide-phosphate guanylyltransferase [Chloroflexota bacterium]